MRRSHHRPRSRARRDALREFLTTEAASGVVLIAATAAALVGANGPWRESYADLWDGDVRHWINDWLMAVFFFVVTLEVKRELVDGELRDPRRAALPVFAAVGGMIVPAGLYLVVAGDVAADGWAIPMATDIAFAIGVAALLGPRVPPELRLFLLTLAIVDDVGAIAVIAIAYAGEVELASLVGIAAGALAPRRVRSLERWLHPLASFVVVPLFALANAGIDLRDTQLTTVTWAVVAGLVVGKPLGITAFAWLAVRSGFGRRPECSWTQLAGAGALAGIGFTVSLFVTGLAFDRERAADATLGVLIASLLAAGVGLLMLYVSSREATVDPHQPHHAEDR